MTRLGRYTIHTYHLPYIHIQIDQLSGQDHGKPLYVGSAEQFNVGILGVGVSNPVECEKYDDDNDDDESLEGNSVQKSREET